MSNERDKTGMDRLVSDAYRELADEQTPDSLNRKVLRMAARKSKTRYSIARAWTRPVAWAATIGLSLAVVLRLTDLPQPDPAYAPVQEAEPVEQKLFETRPENEQQGRQAPPPEKRSRPIMQQQEPAEKASARNEAPFATRNAEVLKEAAEIARMQSGSEQEPVSDTASTMPAVAAAAPLATSVSDDEAETETGHLCPAGVRTSAEKWSECIAALEKTAPRELIEREYEQLHQRFPEFEQSVPNK